MSLTRWVFNIFTRFFLQKKRKGCLSTIYSWFSAVDCTLPVKTARFKGNNHSALIQLPVAGVDICKICNTHNFLVSWHFFMQFSTECQERIELYYSSIVIVLWDTNTHKHRLLSLSHFRPTSSTPSLSLFACKTKTHFYLTNTLLISLKIVIKG